MGNCKCALVWKLKLNKTSNRHISVLHWLHVSPQNNNLYTHIIYATSIGHFLVFIIVHIAHARILVIQLIVSTLLINSEPLLYPKKPNFPPFSISLVSRTWTSVLAGWVRAKRTVKYYKSWICGFFLNNTC